MKKIFFVALSVLAIFACKGMGDKSMEGVVVDKAIQDVVSVQSNAFGTDNKVNIRVSLPQDTIVKNLRSVTAGGENTLISSEVTVSRSFSITANGKMTITGEKTFASDSSQKIRP